MKKEEAKNDALMALPQAAMLDELDHDRTKFPCRAARKVGRAEWRLERRHQRRELRDVPVQRQHNIIYMAKK
eukprot:15778939-Heterocapsa_arctica.AAC.1